MCVCMCVRVHVCERESETNTSRCVCARVRACNKLTQYRHTQLAYTYPLSHTLQQHILMQQRQNSRTSNHPPTSPAVTSYMTKLTHTRTQETLHAIKQKLHAITSLQATTRKAQTYQQTAQFPADWIATNQIRL